jgi:hypothetical protein
MQSIIGALIILSYCNYEGNKQISSFFYGRLLWWWWRWNDVCRQLQLNRLKCTIRVGSVLLGELIGRYACDLHPFIFRGGRCVLLCLFTIGSMAATEVIRGNGPEICDAARQINNTWSLNSHNRFDDRWLAIYNIRISIGGYCRGVP